MAKTQYNKCGNCYDGKLLMPGEMCGMCGNCEPAPRKPKPQRTCVYCGCTDNRACAGGCAWAVLHPKTLTGVCTGCVGRLPGIALGILNITPPRNGKVWMQVNAGESAGEGGEFDAAKLAAHVEKFYRKHF